MNEQEQIMLEFIEWLPKNIKEFSSAKSSDEVVAMLNDIQKSENGEMKLKELFSAFQKSKQNMTKMYDKGGRLEYLLRKISELDRQSTNRNVSRGGMGYVTTATSGDTDYNLNTNGRDSLMWVRFNDGLTRTLSNSGTNNTWKGYDQVVTPNGVNSVELPDSVTSKLKEHMFKKLGVK